LSAILHSIGLASLLMVKHRNPKSITKPSLRIADAKNPIPAHERMVRGLASCAGFVNNMSIALSESKAKNQGINEPEFHFTSPVSKMEKAA
jgi:hypothetical protein